MAGVLRPNNFFIVARVLFPAGALVSLIVAAAAVATLLTSPQTAVLPLGLPGMPFHLRMDALSSIFLLLLGGASAGISVFAAG
jgi:formate hydrogenlyase subunit 3/multisubunit Na+/H+ antiporter MnhD subunit